MIPDPQEFRTAPFRLLAKRLMEEVQRLKDDALVNPTQAPHVHPHRCGIAEGLKRAGAILVQAEKELLGETK